MHVKLDIQFKGFGVFVSWHHRLGSTSVRPSIYCKYSKNIKRKKWTKKHRSTKMGNHIRKKILIRTYIRLCMRIQSEIYRNGVCAYFVFLDSWGQRPECSQLKYGWHTYSNYLVFALWFTNNLLYEIDAIQINATQYSKWSSLIIW